LKKFWIIAGLLVFFPGAAAWGTDYVWVGTVYGGNGMYWDDPDNWEDVTAPGYPASDYPGASSGDTARVNGPSVTVGVNTPIPPLDLDALYLDSGADVVFNTNVASLDVIRVEGFNTKNPLTGSRGSFRARLLIMVYFKTGTIHGRRTAPE
jgi:hypothetical protein